MLHTLLKLFCTRSSNVKKKLCRFFNSLKSCKIIRSTSEDALKIFTCYYSSTTWVNGSRELQINCMECKLIFLKSKTVDTHMKRQRSDMHPIPSNWVIASGELQFDCNKCNLIFVKLNTFNTHMKKKHYLALGRHRITLLGKLYKG